MSVIISVVRRITASLTSLESQSNWIKTKNSTQNEHMLCLFSITCCLPLSFWGRRRGWLTRQIHVGAFGGQVNLVWQQRNITAAGCVSWRATERRPRWDGAAIKAPSLSHVRVRISTFYSPHQHFSWGPHPPSSHHNSTSINDSKSAEAPVIITSSRILFFFPSRPDPAQHPFYAVCFYVYDNKLVLLLLSTCEQNPNILLLRPALIWFFLLFFSHKLTSSCGTLALTWTHVSVHLVIYQCLRLFLFSTSSWGKYLALQLLNAPSTRSLLAVSAGVATENNADWKQHESSEGRGGTKKAELDDELKLMML